MLDRGLHIDKDQPERPLRILTPRIELIDDPANQVLNRPELRIELVFHPRANLIFANPGMVLVDPLRAEKLHEHHGQIVEVADLQFPELVSDRVLRHEINEFDVVKLVQRIISYEDVI